MDSTTNVIVNSTSFASVPIPPGHTAVLKSVVDAACSCESRGRGLWDGTTYTLPASLTAADHRRGPAQGGGAETVPTVDRVDGGPREAVSGYWTSGGCVSRSRPACLRAPGRAGRRALAGIVDGGSKRSSSCS